MTELFLLSRLGILDRSPTVASLTYLHSQHSHSFVKTNQLVIFKLNAEMSFSTGVCLL